MKRQHKQQQNQGSKSRRPPGPGSWPWDKRRAAPSCAYRWSRHGRGRGGRGNRKPHASVRVRVFPFLSFPFPRRAVLSSARAIWIPSLRAPSPLKPLSSSFLFFSWFSILLVVDVECSGPKGGAGFRKTNETKRQKKIRKYKDTRIRPLLCKFGHPTPHTSPAAPAPARMSLVLVRLTLVFAFAL